MFLWFKKTIRNFNKKIWFIKRFSISLNLYIISIIFAVILFVVFSTISFKLFLRLFLNLKSYVPYATAASCPFFIYGTFPLCWCLSTISNSEIFNTALYNVVLTWQFPPPNPCFFFPSTYISAFWYPLLVVDFPTVLQNENVSPALISLPFNALHVIVILFCLSSSLL